MRMRWTLPCNDRLASLAASGLLLLVIFAVGCAPLAEPADRATPFSSTRTAPAATGAPQVTGQPAAPVETQADQTDGAATQAPQTPTAQAVVETGKPEPTSPLSGLVLRTADGILRFDSSGELKLLAPGSQGKVSPDGKSLVYVLDDPATYVSDIWLMDLGSGEAHNLTNTADRYEGNPSWWPGQPQRVIFTSDVEMGMASSEYPTMVNLDGSGYTVLDESMGGRPAVSPDGKEIIYGGYNGKAAIYRVEGEDDEFDPASFGIPAEKLSAIAWAPAGRKIAAVLSGHRAGSSEILLGVGIFDLDAGSGELFHVYTPQGGGEIEFQIAWSPDGQRLAFTTYWEDPGAGRTPALWVMEADGSREYSLGPGSNPVWSPDGSQLAFLKPDETGFSDLWLADAADWSTQSAGEQISPPILFLEDWDLP